LNAAAKVWSFPFPHSVRVGMLPDVFEHILFAKILLLHSRLLIFTVSVSLADPKKGHRYWEKRFTQEPPDQLSADF
jgi:hypothetical protein